jgi:pimeloyl-ACP methyl ester carboxylesterase
MKKLRFYSVITLLTFIILFSNSIILSAQVDPVRIDLRNNGNKLDAKFYYANKLASQPVLILLHGFPGNADSPYGLAERLFKRGMNILVFNYEGSFNSEGSFSWENCMMDVGAAVSFLRQEKNIRQFSIDTSRIIVCGCSLGAALALSAAVHDPDIRNIIAVAGGNDLSVYLQKMNRDPGFRTALEKRIATSGKPNIKGDSAYIHNYFGMIMPKYEYFDLIKNAEKLRNKEILFITGWSDTTVPMEEFIIPAYRNLKTLYPESVSIKALETDHFFSNTREELANSIIEWVNK